MAYAATGGGPPLLLIAGLGAGRWVWEPQVKGLGSDFRVITFDNRGIGASTAPPGRLTVGRMAADAVAVLDGLGIDRAHVGGMSMGGFIAQTVAVRYPERVDRLVLMCTAGRGAGEVWPAPQLLGLVLGGLRSGGIAGARLRVFFSAGYLEENREETERWVRLARESLPDRRIVFRQLVAAAAFSAGGAALAKMPHPTLVIHGTGDRIIPVAAGKRLARRIPGAHLVLLDGAGHGVTVERAAEVNREIAAFLEASCDRAENP